MASWPVSRQAPGLLVSSDPSGHRIQVSESDRASIGALADRLPLIG
jgi:hypothetical protein